ncbi:MAG: GTP-binding protein [Rhodospirillales bacterium]|nr:GTP-binding protein [Rhodospirillales bacterium]
MGEIRSIPTSIVTGFFGVGKTTTIASLIQRKPEDEKWAILVNEFGEIGVDGAVLEGGISNGVEIREIIGGCLCCTANVPMRVAVTEILRRTHPDRLLIEPTGIGHPAGILDELRGPDLCQAVDVRAVICIVDPRLVHDPRIQGAAIFRDQVSISDILIAGKADLASAAELDKFRAWAGELFPPKDVIDVVSKGELDIGYLDCFPSGRRNEQGAASRHAPAGSGNIEVVMPAAQLPTRKEASGEGYKSCGWLFSADDVFDRSGITDLLGPPGLAGAGDAGAALRLKGVFRIGRDWILLNRSGGEFDISDIAYRRDSRLEIIVPDSIAADWDRLELDVLSCLKS